MQQAEQIRIQAAEMQLAALENEYCNANWAFTASGSAARHATGDASLFTDLTIGGIIDFWEPDG